LIFFDNLLKINLLSAAVRIFYDFFICLLLLFVFSNCDFFFFLICVILIYFFVDFYLLNPKLELVLLFLLLFLLLENPVKNDLSFIELNKSEGKIKISNQYLGFIFEYMKVYPNRHYF